MSNTTKDEKKTESIDHLLGEKFVIELLQLVADLRDALGDENGDLENHELVKRARTSYKG